MLFGTAMNKDIAELKKNFCHLVSYDSAQNKLINLNSQHITGLEQQVTDIASCTNLFRFIYF